jgi:hypothetical protein
MMDNLPCLRKKGALKEKAGGDLKERERLGSEGD